VKGRAPCPGTHCHLAAMHYNTAHDPRARETYQGKKCRFKSQ
jgi:hypothetical protein